MGFQCIFAVLAYMDHPMGLTVVNIPDPWVCHGGKVPAHGSPMHDGYHVLHISLTDGLAMGATAHGWRISASYCEVIGAGRWVSHGSPVGLP